MKRSAIVMCVGLVFAANGHTQVPNFQADAEKAAADVRNSISDGSGKLAIGGVEVDSTTIGLPDGGMSNVDDLMGRAGQDPNALTRGLGPNGGSGVPEMVPGKTFNQDIMQSMRETKQRVESQDMSVFDGGALVSEGQLLQFGAESVFGGCREVTTTKTVTVGEPRRERRACLRSEGLQFGECTVTRSLGVTYKRIKGEGRFGFKVDTWMGSETPWQGDAECLNVLRNRQNFIENGCTMEIEAKAWQSRVIDGVTITPTTPHNTFLGVDIGIPPTFQQFSMPIGGVGNRLTDRVTLKSAKCPAGSGNVSFGGITSFVEPENSCGSLNTAGCTLAATNCITRVDGPLGSYCAEEELIYDCTIPGSQRTKEITRTELVCGNDDEIYCVDGSCFTQIEDTNADFAKAAALLSAVQSIATHMECADPNNPSTCRIFEGEELACRKGSGGFASLWDCCDIGGGANKIESDDYIKSIVEAGANFSVSMFKDGVKTFFDAAEGIIQFLVPCNKDEMKLATTSTVDARIYLGRRCGKKINLGFDKVCIRRDSHYCAWESPLGRIIMQQANPQFGRSFGGPGYGNCRGLSIGDIQNLDWNGLDLGEWATMMLDAGAIDAAGLTVDPGEVNQNLVNPAPAP